MVTNLGELGLNLQNLVNRLIANQSLLKLLYYTDVDPLSHADLTTAQIKEHIFNKLLRVTPTIVERDEAKSAVAIKVSGGYINPNNGDFRDIKIVFEIYVPHVSWIIKDSNFRAFAIMGQIQQSLNNKTVGGLGTFYCSDFSLEMVTEEASLYVLEGGFTEYD